MKRIFKIGGLSCNKCAEKITGNLLKHPAIKNSTVYLDKKIVEIDLIDNVPIMELQKAMSADNKYFIRKEIGLSSSPF